MKKILSFVLALLMSASAASFVGAAEEAEAAIAAEDNLLVATEETADTISEAEAEARAQHADALALLDAWDILHGRSKDNPAAAENIKRYEMALFVSRISTGWTDDTKWAVADQWYDRDHDTSGFDDLEGSGAINFLGALSYASQKGIILGYGNKKFGPEDGITYQDALTMIVRTLGYYNLSWPWGNIEKAVTLGLTVGIPKTVKYTDILNRGQVAQIIYNALFATTKDGDTLAARNFNGDLDWKSIIITVAGKKGYFLPLEDKDLYLPGAKLLADQQKLGFKVVNKDGTLSEQTYWVKTTQIPNYGFTDRLENYLGFAYKALFTKDADSNYVTLEWLKPVQDGVVWNEGSKSVKGEFPIYDYLKDLNLRSKFSFVNNTYLNDWNGNYGWKEIIVMDALQGKATVKVDVGNRYGIDWSETGKGNIVERVEKEDDADYTVNIPNKDGKDEKVFFKIAWRWNDTINAYFKYVYKDAADGTKELVGIDILDQKDIDEMMKNLTLQKDESTKRGLIQITEGDYSKWAKTAYASLIPFTLNDASAPNYGLFEEYRLGQFTDADIKCTKDNADKKGFKIYALNAVSDMAVKLFKEKGVTGGDLNDKDFNKLFEDEDWGRTTKYSGIYEDSCDHGFYWYNDAYGLKKPENDSYVIYSVDEGTGEIKIVKVIYSITDEKHKDTDFVANGIVRAYNIEKRTVTIGDVTYDWDYNCLADCGLVLEKPDKKEFRAEFTYLFKTLFNQYVEYVVCDGKLVYIKLAGKSADLIIVDSYAGLSSDNYIVVNGWDTKNLYYRQYKIGSYNGWVKGDYYYYPDQAKVDKAFERGTIYKINSSNISETDEIYYVSTVALANALTARYQRGYASAGSGMYDLDELVEKKIVDNNLMKIEINSGYRKIAKADKFADAEWEKAEGKHKYVLICNPIGTDHDWNNGVEGKDWHDLDGVDLNEYVYGSYAPIIVYKGTGSSKLAWEAYGYKVNGVGNDTTVFVNVDFLDVIGFNRDQWDISYVLFLTYEYETATYDAYGHSKDWYLLGASEFTAQCFNFYTGKVESYIAVNKDLRRGYAYPAMNGQIVDDEIRFDACLATACEHSVNGAITAAYKSGTRYIFGHGIMKDYNTYVNSDGKTVTGLLWNKDEVSKQILSPRIGPKDLPFTGGVKGLTGETAVFLVDTEKELDSRRSGPEYGDTYGKHVKFKNVENISVEEFDKWAKSLDLATVSFWYIHDKDANRTVFYIQKDGVAVAKGPIAIETKDVIDVSNTTPDYAYISSTIEGTADYRGITQDDLDKKVADGKYPLDKVIGATFGTLEISFIGQATGDTHHAVDTNDYHFGKYGKCEKEDWETKIVVDGIKYRLVGSITEIRYKTHDVEDNCELIQAVKVPLNGKFYDEENEEILSFKDIVVPTYDETTEALITPVKFSVILKDSNGTEYTFNYVIDVTVDAKGIVTIGFNYDQTTPATLTLGQDYQPNPLNYNETILAAVKLPTAPTLIAREFIVK